MKKIIFYINNKLIFLNLLKELSKLVMYMKKKTFVLVILQKIFNFKNVKNIWVQKGMVDRKSTDEAYPHIY